MFIDIVEVWFGIANVQISVRDKLKFSFPDNNLRKCQCIFTKLGIYIDIVEIWDC